MRVVLIYPPPWKIAAATDPSPGPDGPPEDLQTDDIDPDFSQVPYGLLTLAGEAMAHGHAVTVQNLSLVSWSEIERLVAALDADVWGLSCWTANRRGMGYVAECIRRHHPAARIVVGGPHATVLGSELLEHHAAIDVVCIGESERTFIELLTRFEQGEPVQGTVGTVTRGSDGLVVGPIRARIEDLDSLVPPQRHFDTHVLMTSRGCPWACSFCGAESVWGRGYRSHSTGYVLEALELALARLPVRMIQIKDDTFTANARRVLDLCRGIRERGLRFLWSCDSRADVLSDELLREMRLAGCERLSLGVESGSQRVLDSIGKGLEVEQVIAATEAAQRYGIKVRYYMMLGNRGETAQSFRESLELVERAKPEEVIFSCLSIYPGTPDFREAERRGRVTRDLYLTGTFLELKMPFDASPADTELMDEWFSRNKGIRRIARRAVPECRAILARLGDHAPAHLDLAGALYHEARLEEAAHHAQQALLLGHPTPGLAHNYLACIAFRLGDIEGMKTAFLTAARCDPQHAVLIENVQAARAWFSARGPERGAPLALKAHHDFALFEQNRQPCLPGPIDESFGPQPS
jgi:radical SAM superfamily enzyme YgiQ (UPF0313 family)